MGYTNYWRTKKLTENQIDDEFWNDAEKVLDAIIEKGVALADGMGEHEFESGHEIINNTVMSDDWHPSIVLNGLGEQGYETFALCFDGSWCFCKTGEQPYDLAVKCLLMLAHKYGYLTKEDEEELMWDFDGAQETDLCYQEANALMMSLELI